jgi:DNA-binding MarR family transcriptional regulator
VLSPHDEEMMDAPALVSGHDFAQAMAICLWANYYSLNSISETEKEFLLNRDDCNVLLTLWRCKKMTATDISFLNGRPKNSIGRAVKRLLDRKLINTTADDQDSRKKLLQITDSGSEIVEAMAPIFIRNQESMLSRLSKAQRNSLHSAFIRTFTDLSQWNAARET